MTEEFLLSPAGEVLTTDTFPFTIQSNWKLLRDTGLKDKAGTKIFEGSIVRLTSTTGDVTVWAIEYVPDTMRFVLTKDVNDRDALTIAITRFREKRRIMDGRWLSVEVIGDIYQRAHLVGA